MLSRDKLENKQEAAKVTLTEEFNIVLMLVPRPVRLLCLPGLIKRAYRLKALKVFNFVFKKTKPKYHHLCNVKNVSCSNYVQVQFIKWLKKMLLFLHLQTQKWKEYECNKKLYMLLYIISALFLNSTNCVFYYMDVEKTLLPYSEKNPRIISKSKRRGTQATNTGHHDITLYLRRAKKVLLN